MTTIFQIQPTALDTGTPVVAADHALPDAPVLAAPVAPLRLAPEGVSVLVANLDQMFLLMCGGAGSSEWQAAILVQGHAVSREIASLQEGVCPRHWHHRLAAEGAGPLHFQMIGPLTTASWQALQAQIDAIQTLREEIAEHDSQLQMFAMRLLSAPVPQA